MVPVLGDHREGPGRRLCPCPELQGCYTQGTSYEESLEKVRDAIPLHVEDRIEAGEGDPPLKSRCDRSASSHGCTTIQFRTAKTRKSPVSS